MDVESFPIFHIVFPLSFIVRTIMGQHNSKAILFVPGYFGIPDEGPIRKWELFDSLYVEFPNDHFLVAIFVPYGFFLEFKDGRVRC